jgi:hypothetical protein
MQFLIPGVQTMNSNNAVADGLVLGQHSLLCVAIVMDHTHSISDAFGSAKT